MSDFKVPDSIAQLGVLSKPFVEHAGVPGMRWGKRQPGTRGGTPPGSHVKGINKKSMSKKAATLTAGAVFTGTAFTAKVLSNIGGWSIEKLMDLHDLEGRP